MKFYSTNNSDHQVNLADAVIKGLAPDQGLYIPMEIPVLPKELLDKFPEMSFQEIGYEVIGALFSTALSQEQIKKLVDHTLTFDAPLVKVEEGVYSLELFHGPTLAFKDFGARFCSKLMSMLIAKSDQKVRVLVATSGDTGSAVANGFLGVDGVEVIILFPKGKVSELQEKQFTTLGQNITALEVDGVFDDCQKLVKDAFLDAELNEKLLLTSANSINVARWIPQCLYYFYAFSRLPINGKKVAFAVPSGNFGNIAAGILAQRMGLPIDQFVAATNMNKVVPDFLNGADFLKMSSIATISNSMDVGNPSNFPRLLALYGDDANVLKDNVKGYFYSDEETIEAMQAVKKMGYTLDPHGAVGYKGLKDFMTANAGFQGVFLETAHPGKFRETVEKALDLKLTLPERLAAFMDGEKKVEAMGNDFEEFKGYLMEL
ncbi:threonine synthase [Algoriphagus sp. D3-2-R+10]|uniref:threonine synthase n=1 Tax=Algoriphagus aurantiacus TaxID=3103948 RepID=UPI002B3B3541|nr:threonine synthase [Algoriphagus sp. D3-2-R+10]MEB2775732.1 threonine synthase [Algoriphagus sp. D3-2-R+10]